MDIRSWAQIINDEGSLGITTRASIQQVANRFRYWPLELAFHSRRKGHIPICTSIMARNMATLLMADLHPTGGPEIWSRNRISSSITSRISIRTDSEGCPLNNQPFPPPLFLLQKIIPLWEHGVHNWTQILGRTPNGRPYFLEDREFKWANPTMTLPLPQELTHALHYLRVLLSSKDAESWRRLMGIILTLKNHDLPISPRWRRIFDSD